MRYFLIHEKEVGKERKGRGSQAILEKYIKIEGEVKYRKN